MLYALICKDKSGALDIRTANRDAHLEHIRAAEGAVVQAGPFLDEQGQMCGSLIIYEADDPGEVEAWSAADPYAKAGLFASVEIRPWKKVVG